MTSSESSTTPVYVVILNWNGRENTLACLASLAQSSYPIIRAIVVDQASTDGSVEKIRQQFPHCEIVQTGGNIGFARGMNAGIRHALSAGAAHILLLNNDVIVSPTMVERLVSRLAPDIGIASPAIFFADRPHDIWSAGGDISAVLYEMTGAHGRSKPLPKQPAGRGFLSGCAMLLQRPVLEIVGLFDERFFMYYEDLDVCVRMREAGFRLLLVPDAHLWHKVSQSSGGVNSPAERYHMARSSGIYFRKHMHGWRTPPIVAFRCLSALRWTIRLTKQRNLPALVSYWRGLLEGWFCTRNPAP